MNGKFISIEGLEGVGKTTQAQVICKWLEDNGIDYIRTREPGGTEIAESIRELVLEHHKEKMDSKTELLLVFAARQQHVETLIKPALASGKWVLSDRFTDATYAYQGGGRELDTSLIAELEQLILKDFQPHTTIWFDCDAQTGLSRARARGALDRIELEDISFFDRCRKSYLNRSLSDPSRFIKLDAAQDIKTVSDDLIAALNKRFKSDS